MESKSAFWSTALLLGMVLNLAEAQTFSNLYNFTNGTDGADPRAAVILSGNTLYGVTYFGGISGNGTVFSVNADGTGFTNVYSFTATDQYLANNDGASPNAGLILSGSALYGTAYYGGTSACGTVFRVNTDGTGFTNLHNFTGGYDFGGPEARLVLSGNTLYGTTAGNIFTTEGEGETYTGNGTVFAINTDGTGFTNLHSFSGAPDGGPYGNDPYFTNSDGAFPQAGLVLSRDTLYGTAYWGGASGVGTVFTVNTDGTGFRTLYSFSPGANGERNRDGANPTGGLILSGSTLYGTTGSGGSFGDGTVFAINADGTAFTNLNNAFGYSPYALVLSSNTLYGTANDGISGDGTVFAVNTNGTGFTTLYDFTGLSPGNDPPSVGLIFSGNLIYGTASGGGSFGSGAVFSMGTNVGSLYVAIVPPGAVNAGAKWQVDSNTFQDNQTLAGGLSVGNYTISFSTVSGWTTPASQSLSIQYGVTTSAIAVYTLIGTNGVLSITLLPSAAVSAGAEWRVNGGTFHASGDTITNLAPTNVTVSFKTIPGFATPSNQTASISSGQTIALVANYEDTNKPTLSIVSPKTGITVSNADFTVSGTAKDNVAVASVYVQFNGRSWTNALSSNAWINWTASVTLIPGANTISAYAVDTSGNNSITNTVTFKYIPSATLIVRTNGFGGIAPVENGKLLVIGTSYTLTALASKNWMFSNWVASGSANFGSDNPVLKFTMQSNLVLQANFVPNPFIPEQGVFNGLFLDTNDVTEAISGFFTLNLVSCNTVYFAY